MINPLSTEYDYIRLKSVLLADQINVSENEMGV